MFVHNEYIRFFYDLITLSECHIIPPRNTLENPQKLSGGEDVEPQDE